MLWNSESALPSGLLPTFLDSALGLPPHWLDDHTLGDSLYARRARTTTLRARALSTSLAQPK